MYRIQYVGEARKRNPGCPSILIPPCSIPISSHGIRRDLMHKVVAIHLLHRAKNNLVKSFLPLKDIHLYLEKHSFMLQLPGGSSNILLCKVTFYCLIDNRVRDYITFDLRIPEANTERNPVFSYDYVAAMYGEQNLLSTLQFFYELGRNYVNPENLKHGHVPLFKPSHSSHAQYIRHTEQMLIAYLHHPHGAEMLSNRLHVELRAKYPYSFHAKIYNMILHMHSTKTCCSPCEYSLIGLMNAYEFLSISGINLGFIPNFRNVCLQPRDNLNFSFPKRSSFQVITTMSAHQPTDLDHRKKPIFEERRLEDQQALPYYEISLKSQESRKQIFTTVLDNGYDKLRFPVIPSHSEMTVLISGSDISPGTPKTKELVLELKRNQLGGLISIPRQLFRTDISSRPTDSSYESL